MGISFESVLVVVFKTIFFWTTIIYNGNQTSFLVRSWLNRTSFITLGIHISIKKVIDCGNWLGSFLRKTNRSSPHPSLLRRHWLLRCWLLWSILKVDWSVRCAWSSTLILLNYRWFRVLYAKQRLIFFLNFKLLSCMFLKSFQQRLF